MLNTIRGSAEHMNRNSGFPNFGVIALCVLTISCPLHNFKTTWHIFMKLDTNVNIMRWHAEHMNRNSCFPTFRVIALWVLKMAISTIHMCPLYILKIVWDIFMKLHTNVKHNNRMGRTQEP